jgi:thymidylate synthase
LCWYLAGTNELTFIDYYLPEYRKYAENGAIWGGYGPRLFRATSGSGRQLDQVGNILDTLKRKPGSRQAVIQLFEANDLAEPHKDIPCTCTLQFMVREDQLHMITYMRSNDVFWGLPHDIFCFTMFQEIVARSLNIDVGTYKHMVGSLHFYDAMRQTIEEYLGEGWQTTKMPMPPMPVGDPWAHIGMLLVAERELRERGVTGLDMKSLDPYWADIVRLLEAFRSKKESHSERIRDIRKEMSSNAFDVFLESLERRAA